MLFGIAWYWYVIGGLAAMLALAVVALTIIARVGGEFGKEIIGSWAKGNFGKRGG